MCLPQVGALAGSAFARGPQRRSTRLTLHAVGYHRLPQAPPQFPRHPPPPPRMSLMISNRIRAPMVALTIAATRPVPRWMPSCGSSQLPMKAPMIPMMISPTIPNPVPCTICPASHPATRATTLPPAVKLRSCSDRDCAESLTSGRLQSHPQGPSDGRMSTFIFATSAQRLSESPINLRDNEPILHLGVVLIAPIPASLFHQGVQKMRRFLLTLTATAAVLTAGALVPSGASATPLGARLALDDMNPIQNVAICFYVDGWNGPGLYDCGS